MAAPGRPDPDALLARVVEAAARSRRGRLKLFFGAAPGVGTTYTMLEAARAEGEDVVAGVVAQITGVVVRETVPGAIFERADEVELVDVSAEVLLERLREGKVNVPEQAARAGAALPGRESYRAGAPHPGSSPVTLRDPAKDIGHRYQCHDRRALQQVRGNGQMARAHHQEDAL